MKRGDIVIAAAPGDYGKPRPFVVVQSDQLTDAESVILCPITSDLRDLSFRPRLEPEPNTGLRALSEIMTDKIMAVSRSRVAKIVGGIDPAAMSQLDEQLAAVLGLSG